MLLVNIPAFQTAIANCGTDYDAIEQVCIIERDRIYKTSASVAGIKTAFTRIRKVFSTDTITDAIVRKTLVLTVDMMTEFRYQQNARVIADLDIKLNRRHLLDVDGYIATAVSNLTSNSVARLIMALAIVTGRRTYEVACTGDFEYIDDNTLLFAGQAKTRNRTDIAPYAIPVLCNATLILNAIDTLRAKRPDLIGLDDDAFNATMASQLVPQRKPYAKYVSDKKFITKDARPIYAILCWIKYDKKQCSFTRYSSRLLGHRNDDVNTAQSYDDFNCTDWDTD